jgi:hypothetical protein
MQLCPALASAEYNGRKTDCAAGLYEQKDKVRGGCH